MTFVSLTFAIFFVAVLAISRSGWSWTVRKRLLLLSSYFFYAVWDPPFVILLWLSTAVDGWLARAIAREERQHIRTVLLISSLCVNLGLLVWFKYAAFIGENLTLLTHQLGGSLQFEATSLVLPVGISFYTFQTISYTIDVYRRVLTPSASMTDYALYVSFFPQLVAGPIVRAGHFLPQTQEASRASHEDIAWGLSMLSFGLFQKVVLADALFAPAAHRVFDAVHQSEQTAAAVSTLDAWTGALAFTGQIFCDFSGYSMCAIGVALTLGFHLPDNFRAPYAAIGFSDFWRRWHITLSSWLRDYLYIPLGGNRKGIVRTFLALFITMLLGGLWHGAGWTFVAWGALHGLLLIAERMLQHITRPWTIDPRYWRLPATAVTFLLVCFTWILFRAETFHDALQLFKAIFGLDAATANILPGWQMTLVAILTLFLLAFHQLFRDTTLEEHAGRLPSWLRTVIIGLLLFFVMVTPGSNDAFIYFQF